MKTIYVNNDILKEAVSYLNNEITFFGFLSHVKFFLKELLVNPLEANIDEYLKNNGLNRKELLNILINKGIIEKETKIIDKNGKDEFSIKYNIPKRNFERKMRRLYASLFEKNEIKESIISEEEGGMAGGGGATNCSSSGQYATPVFGKVQRRKIYITNEQLDMLKETTTQSVGDYQYDVPLMFNKGKDPSFNHKNIIANGVPRKKNKNGKL